MYIRELPNPTVEEYLAGERDGEVRHDYINGCIYAMTGASARHNLIAGNIFSSLHSKAQKTVCKVFMADMKVRITEWNAFYYPDVMLCCDPQDKEDYYRERPCMIIEVSSPGTVGVDRREKLAAYQTLSSLEEYLLIDQDRQAVEVYRRKAEKWILEELNESDELRIECLDFGISVADIYSGIEVNGGLAS